MLRCNPLDRFPEIDCGWPPTESVKALVTKAKEAPRTPNGRDTVISSSAAMVAAPGLLFGPKSSATATSDSLNRLIEGLRTCLPRGNQWHTRTSEVLSFSVVSYGIHAVSPNIANEIANEP